MRLLATMRRKAARGFVERFGPLWRFAEISAAKFLDYSMNPLHPDNRNKAAAFAALGWDVADLTSRSTAAAEVIRQLRSGLPAARTRRSREDQYGLRFETDTHLIGPNGRAGTLFAAWMVDHSRITPRLITSWLRVHV